MAGETVDEWTPALERYLKALSEDSQRLALSDVGYRTVVRAKQLMQRQLGFGDLTPYKKLRIRWRYHGHKVLAGGDRVIKSAVTAASQALIDLGDLLRSWDVLRLTTKQVDVGPKTPAEMAKAHYNDDRGDWSWGDPAADFAHGVYMGHFDKEAGFK